MRLVFTFLGRGGGGGRNANVSRGRDRGRSRSWSRGVACNITHEKSILRKIHSETFALKISEQVEANVVQAEIEVGTEVEAEIEEVEEVGEGEEKADILIEKTVGKCFVLQMCAPKYKCFVLSSNDEIYTLAFLLFGHK